MVFGKQQEFFVKLGYIFLNFKNSRIVGIISLIQTIIYQKQQIQLHSKNSFSFLTDQQSEGSNTQKYILSHHNPFKSIAEYSLGSAGPRYHVSNSKLLAILVEMNKPDCFLNEMAQVEVKGQIILLFQRSLNNSPYLRIYQALIDQYFIKRVYFQLQNKQSMYLTLQKNNGGYKFTLLVDINQTSKKTSNLNFIRNLIFFNNTNLIVFGHYVSNNEQQQTCSIQRRPALDSQRNQQIILGSTASSQQPQYKSQYQEVLGENVKDFNSKAFVLMQQQKWEQSLLILQEAERLLQAATTKGLNVERQLIQCIFHNEACCYQNLWQLEQCSNYIQALIYNFNCKTNDSSSLDQNNQAKYNFASKLGLAKYYLQFCAVNSQLGNHSGALISSRKALDIIKKEFVVFNKNTQKQNNKIKSQNQQKLRLLNIVCHFNDNINLQNLQILQECTSYYLRMQRQNSIQKYNFGKEIRRKVQNFSIKTIMQMQPLTYQNFINSLRNQNTNSLGKLLDMLFVFSTCYFTMATQLRIMSLLKMKEVNSQQKLNHPQLKQSFIYHLFSILVLTLTINLNSPFIQHLIVTYNNHYNTDLLSLNPPFKKIYNELVYLAQPKMYKQLSIICNDHDQGMGSLISKGSGTFIRFTKSSKQSERQHKCSQLDSKKRKSKSKKKITTKIKIDQEKSKRKKTSSSLSKSPSSKSPIVKGCFVIKPQKSKDCIGIKMTIPSIKQIFGKVKQNMDDLGRKNTQKEKTTQKSKKKGKIQDRINEYFLNKGTDNKMKKSSISTKKSTSQVKSSGRLPINSTLQAKQAPANVGKEKKKSSKKNILQHYM